MNYLKLKRTAEKLSQNTNEIVIDLSCLTSNHAGLKKLQTLRNDLQGIKSMAEGNQSLFPIYDHPLSVGRQKYIA